MNHLHEAYNLWLMRACLCGLGLIAIVFLCYFTARGFREYINRVRRCGRIAQFMAVAVTIAMIAYGGTKPPGKTWGFTFANGLRDDGSVCDGDEIRAKWQPTSPILMNGYEVKAKYRDNTMRDDDGNLTDEWHDLEGCAVSALEKTWIVQNATNMSVMVWAQYVAPPTVHTNGVYKLSGVTREMGGTMKYVTPGIQIRAANGSTLTILTPTNKVPVTIQTKEIQK